VSSSEACRSCRNRQVIKRFGMNFHFRLEANEEEEEEEE
jgi:hypothetical protein